MNLLSIALSFDTTAADVIGTFMFSDPDATSGTTKQAAPNSPNVQVNVRPQLTPPGWQLLDTGGQPMTDPTDEVTRETDRLMRSLTIPAAEVMRREKAVRAVIHSGYLSGFEEDSDWQTQLWRFARGELTAEELHTWARHTTIQRSARAEDESVPQSSMPQAWWDAVHARYNQRLLDLSAPSTEIAVLLDWTSLSDVDYLIAENRMVSYDVYGVERVPTWQVYDAGTLDGRWELLPGLDLVIAAAPEELVASERLTMWMTTSDDFLYLDGVPSTPTDWLTGGQPLRTVVAAMHGRR